MNIIDEMLNDGYTVLISRNTDGMIRISCVAYQRAITGEGKTLQDALKNLSIRVLGF